MAGASAGAGDGDLVMAMVIVIWCAGAFFVELPRGAFLNIVRSRFVDNHV